MRRINDGWLGHLLSNRATDHLAPDASAGTIHPSDLIHDPARKSYPIQAMSMEGNGADLPPPKRTNPFSIIVSAREGISPATTQWYGLRFV